MYDSLLTSEQCGSHAEVNTQDIYVVNGVLSIGQNS